MFDLLDWKGLIEIDVLDGNTILEHYEFENLVTDKGKIYLAKMVGGDITGINKVGLGTVNTAAAYSDLALGNRIALIDITRDYSIDKSVRFLGKVAADTFTTTVTYQEIGLIYKSVTEDVLITHAIFTTPVFQKAANSLSVSYTLSLTSS